MESPNKLKEWEEEEKQSQYNHPLQPNADFSGPVVPRSCTDVLCVLVFVLSNLALGALAGYCYYYGEPKRLVHGWDFRGEMCGTEGLQGRKYTYIPAPTLDIDVSLCLEGCPVTIAHNSLCFYQSDHTSEVTDWPCFTSYPSKPFFNKYCLPGEADYRKEVLSWLQKRDVVITRVIGDVYRAWDVLVIAAMVPVIIAVFVLLWLSCGKGIIILAIVAMLALLFSFSVLVFLTYEEAWRVDDRICNDFHMVDMKSCDSGDETLPYRILAFSLIGLTALLVLGVIAKVGKVVPGTEFLQLAIGPIRSSYWLIGLIMAMMLISGALYTLFLTLLTYTGSVSDREMVSSSLVPGGEYKVVSFSGVTRGLIVYEFFLLLWWVSLLTHSMEFISAAFTASWFFSKDRSMLNSPISTAIWNLFRYHFGSILLASIAIPLIRTPRQVLRTVKTILSAMNDKTQHCVATCFGPCFECYEILFKYMNSHALPYQAVWGNTYCESARRGYFLISRGPPQTLLPVHSAEFLLWVIQMGMILSSPLFVYYWIMHVSMTFQGEHTKVVTSVVTLAWISGIFSWQLSELICGFIRGMMYSEVISYLVDKEMFIGVQRFSDISFSAIFHEELSLTVPEDHKASAKLFFTEESQQDLLDLPNMMSSSRPFGGLVIESISSQPSFISDTSDEGRDFSLRPVTPVKAITAISSAQDTARKLTGPMKPDGELYKKPTEGTRRPIVEAMSPEMSVSSFMDSEDEEVFQVPAARPPTRGNTPRSKKQGKKKGPRNL